MTIQENLISAAHLINMEDIIREGNPTLREVTKKVTLPLSDEDILLGEKMLQFLKNSQDETISEKMGLRSGVGIAAPQLEISKAIIACLIPNEAEFDEEGNKIPAKEAYQMATIMYNPKILSHSVEETAIATGEGCLSVDREVEGYVIRHSRIMIEYYDKDSVKHKQRLKGFPAIVVQHEIDHINGIMFYDRINSEQPWKVKEGLQLIN
ncbi:MAG: peptide deformylase [Lactovum sp.]